MYYIYTISVKNPCVKNVLNYINIYIYNNYYKIYIIMYKY